MTENAPSFGPADMGDGDLNALRQLGKPKLWLVGPNDQGAPIDDLLSGRFTVFGKQAQLVPPVDWIQDPHDSRSWRYDLHTLKWLKPLLLRYVESDDPTCLSKARDILLDWADTHLEPAAEVSEFAWYDMAVGLRAPYFAYVLRASVVADSIKAKDAKILLKTAERHGAVLADEAQYAAGHNHGLFQDEGLYMLARQLPILPKAAAWRSRALTRLRSTLEQTINFSEGAHLEHSSAYQFSIAGLVARLAANVQEMPELHDLRDRLRQTAAWHVTPANRLAQLGDTDDVPAPKWACRAASKLHGLNALFETGQAFVRVGSSYLAVSAGFHSSAHKHGDDTGCVLIENGVVVLGDAGRWAYSQDPDRLYAQSSFAHNVMTVDESDFDWRKGEPYGSGLLSADHADGWYVIVITNPQYCRQLNIQHRRQLLYRPGQMLVIADHVCAGAQHNYERRFHFGPRLDANLLEDGRVTVEGDGVTATLLDVGGGGTVEVARGRDKPKRLGWVYPADRERLPVWTTIFRTRAADTTMKAVLCFGDTLPTIPQNLLRPLHAER